MRVLLAVLFTLLLAAPAGAAEWGTPQTVGVGADDISAGIDRHGRSAVVWSTPDHRHVRIAGCTRTHVCRMRKVDDSYFGAVAVAPGGATFVMTTSSDQHVMIRSAASPTGRLSAPWRVDEHAAEYVPELTTTPQGRGYVALQNSKRSLVVRELSGMRRTIKVASDGEPADLSSDAHGNLLLVWARPGDFYEEVLITRIGANGRVGKSRVLRHEVDESFPEQIGTSRALKLAGGPILVTLNWTFFEGADDEYPSGYIFAGRDGGAFSLFKAPTTEDAAFVPAGPRRAVAVSSDTDVVHATIVDGQGPRATRQIGGPAQDATEFTIGGVTSDGDDVAAAWSTDGRIMTADLPAGEAAFEPALPLKNLGGDGREYGGETALALASGGGGHGVLAYTARRDWAVGDDDLVRVAFR